MCVRSEAPWHASAEAFSSHVPPATVRVPVEAPSWTEIVSCDRQVRSARVLCFGLASMAPLVGSMAEELKYSIVMESSMCRCGPLGVNFVHVARTFNE